MVILALNEEETITNVVRGSLLVTDEVMMVNDGGVDRIAEL